MPNYDTPYEAARFQVIRDLIPVGEGVAVDVGCNDGRFTELLPSAGYTPVYGFDSDGSALPSSSSAIRYEAREDDFTVNNRALTMCLEMIEHLPPVAQLEFLTSVRAATAPHGKLLLSTPGRYSPLSIAQRLWEFKKYRVVPYTWWDPTHISVISYARLMRLVQASGFVIEKRVGFCYAPPNIMRPRSVQGIMARAGFDIIIVARAN